MMIIMVIIVFTGVFINHVFFIAIAVIPAPSMSPCTITCPARIVRKIAQRYPAVPRIIAASMI